jgi:hypothetical protein
MEILANKHDHHDPYPGDNGILFEAKDGKSDERLSIGKWTPLKLALYPQCYRCNHVRPYDKGKRKKKLACSAFPEGVPTDIALNIHDHSKSYPGDNGILFDPVQDQDNIPSWAIEY